MSTRERDLADRPASNLEIVNRTLDRVVCSRVTLARTLWARTRGLIGRPLLADGQGLLIEPCQGVHTFFMRHPIDVVFLDAEDRVVALRESLRPWRMTRLFRQAYATLELPAGAVAELGLAVGHQLARID